MLDYLSLAKQYEEKNNIPKNANKLVWLQFP